MGYTSNILAAATIVTLAAAGNAPLANSDLTTGLTYSATLPNTGVDAITGAVLGSIAPDGTGTNFQVSFYNLPGSGSLAYGLYTQRVSNNDCSSITSVLNPYNGVTGSQCRTNPASCEVGDLSDKHGEAMIISGGAGTGFFPANYVDKYVSMDPSNAAFFGNGSIVIHDSTGAAVACANFINASKVSGKNHTTTTSTMSGTSMPSSSGSASSGSGSSGSSSTSAGSAARTASPFVGAGVLGMAALFL